jgi:hypothetical protein
LNALAARAHRRALRRMFSANRIAAATAR